VSYEQLLDVWAKHDPTQKDRQGPYLEKRGLATCRIR